MALVLPSIDQNICQNWTQLDVDFYNRLPYFFAKAQTQFQKRWNVYEELMDTTPWKPGMGDTMRSVMVEPAPFIRQTAFPNLVRTNPLADISSVRERTVDTQLHWQDFVTPVFNWLPNFQDFLRHTQDNMENLARQMEYFKDVYYRTIMWNRAPYVYVAGSGLISAPTGDGDAAFTTAKSNAWLQGAIYPALAGAQPGYLSFQEVFKALNVFEQEVGGTPYEGTGKQGSESGPLDERYCLVTSPEAWNNFTNDPWLKENRPLNMNIVSESFKGDIFGRARTKLERKPFRIAFDNAGNPTYPNPETVELNPASSQFGRTLPNANYARPSLCDTEVAFLVGGPNYSAIEAGPPPSEFTSGTMPPNFPKMEWNGKPVMTKNFLVPCLNAAGQTTYDANSFGRYLRMQATLLVGCAARNPYNVLPIIFKRQFAITTVS